MSLAPLRGPPAVTASQRGEEERRMGLSAPRLPAGGAQGRPHSPLPAPPPLPPHLREPLPLPLGPSLGPSPVPILRFPMSHLALRGRAPVRSDRPSPVRTPSSPAARSGAGPAPRAPPSSEVAPVRPRAGPAALRPALPEPPFRLPVCLVPFKMLHSHFSVYCVLCPLPQEGRFSSTAPGSARCLISTQKVFAD